MAVQKASDLDATDRQVLRELQTDARLAYKELGRRVGLSASAVIERVRKLEDAGVIRCAVLVNAVSCEGWRRQRSPR